MKQNPFTFDSLYGTHQFLKLETGRKLSYSLLGDEKGFPVVHCHGGLMCRLDIAFLSEVARAENIRLIIIDRPGVAYSDPSPGRTLLDWADDVAAVCNKIGVGKFSVTGWSLGGQYAIALGYALPQRVQKVGVISGCIPPDHPLMMKKINLADALLIRLSKNTPRSAKFAFYVIRAGIKIAQGLVNAGMKKIVSAKAPGFIIKNIADDYFSSIFLQALKQLSGMVEEYRVLGSPWGFDPKDMKRPLIWWTGSKDIAVPPAWNPVIKKLFPDVKAIEIEGEGHFLIYSHFGRIMSEMRKGSYRSGQMK